MSDLNTTNKVMRDTDSYQVRILKSGSFTLTVPANSTSYLFSNYVTLNDFKYSSKNIVYGYYNDDSTPSTLAKLNWNAYFFSLSDGGSDKLKITGSALIGTIPYDVTITFYYKIVSGTYAD